MKIKLILPDKDRDPQSLAAREVMLAPAHSSDTVLSVDNIKVGPDNTDSYTDEVFAGPDMIRQCIKAEKDGYDAIVIYCFNDIVINAVRENVSIPVIGPGETTIGLAGILFSKFAIIATQKEHIKMFYHELSSNCVVREKMTSIRSLDIPLVDLRKNPEKTFERIVEVCEEAIQEEQIDGAILGCLAMASFGAKVEQALPIKVLDPAFVAVAFAEMAVRLNLRHSPLIYPTFTGNYPFENI